MSSIQVVLDPAPSVVPSSAVCMIHMYDVPTTLADYAHRVMHAVHGPVADQWRIVGFATRNNDSERIYAARVVRGVVQYGVRVLEGE